MPSTKISGITGGEKTTGVSTDLFEIEEADGSSKNMSLDTIKDYNQDNLVFPSSIIGDIKITETYKEITASYPWFPLMKPDQALSTSNFSQTYIDYERAKKVVYDPADTNVSSFTGAWSSGIFTLDDTDANNAMLDGLSEDYLFQGDYTNFRLVNDGTNDFEITALSASGLTITVDTTDNTPSGTSIEIYLNRVYGSTTSCYHYSEAGLANYQAGDGKIAGLRHRDQMQLLTGQTSLSPTIGMTLNTSDEGVFSEPGDLLANNPSGASGVDAYKIGFKSSNSPDARTSATTDGETMMRSIPIYKSKYVGEYTA